MKKKLLLVVILFPFLKLFSQTNPPDPIVDSCSNYSGNVSYNTGEIYVIYTIMSDQIVSKQTDEPVAVVNSEIPTDLSQESADQSISIYPNPVNNILTFKTTNNKQVIQIKLYSMDGKKILDKQIENNQIDLSSVLQGTYILKTDFDNSINFKIIKR